MSTNTNLYFCQTETTEALIRVAFYNRFFCEPAEVFQNSGMLWAGPVPDPLVHESDQLKRKPGLLDVPEEFEPVTPPAEPSLSQAHEEYQLALEL